MKASQAQLKNISRLSPQAVFDCLRQTKDLRWVAGALVLQALPVTAAHPDQPFGLCVSASKKIAPRAVDRNRIRRRLRAVAVNVIPASAKPGMDYLVSGRKEALTRSAADLENDLRWCLKKLKLLKDAPSDA